jgi:hypothetical protein
MTMIGVAPAPRTAPAASPPAAEPAPAEPASLSADASPAGAGAAAAPAEARVPGASFTLPANPLSELEAADLASFIECTLFETEVDPSTPQGEDPGRPEAFAGAPAPGPAEHDTPPPTATGMLAPPEVPSFASPLRRRLIYAAPYALCTVVGVLAGVALRPSKPAAPSPTATATKTRETAPAPAPAVAPAPPQAAAPAPAAPPPRAAAPAPVEPAAAPAHQAAAGQECFATVTSDPDGARVSWDGRPLGTTPLNEVPVPCGTGTVVMRHERYRSTLHELTAAPGAPAQLSERLRRPPATLLVTSSPPQANITINDEPLGPTPRKLDTRRYEHLRVQASLPGYAPWTRTVYIKGPVTKLTVQLSPTAKSESRAARSTH